MFSAIDNFEVKSHCGLHSTPIAGSWHRSSPYGYVGCFRACDSLCQALEPFSPGVGLLKAAPLVSAQVRNHPCHLSIKFIRLSHELETVDNLIFSK